MIEKLDIICKAEYTLASEVTDYRESIDGTVTLTADWTEIPIHVGANTTFNHIMVPNPQGYISQTQINLALRSEFDQPAKILLKLTFASGTILIIGNPDQTITRETAINRDAFSINLSLQSRKKPHKLA